MRYQIASLLAIAIVTLAFGGYAAAAQKTDEVVMVLRGTASTSLSWQPPHVSSATRRSPGLTNFTNAADSCSSAVYVRGGFAELFQISGWRGCTCAMSLVVAAASPPWQSVQPSRTAAEACMGSIFLWQVTQPRDFSLYGAVDLGARKAAAQRAQEASRPGGPDGTGAANGHVFHLPLEVE